MLAEGIDEYQCLLETDRPELVLFYEDNFNFLSKMCLGTMRRAACEMIGSAKRVGAGSWSPVRRDRRAGRLP